MSYGTTAARAFVYECTDAGTSHGTTEPTWPTTVGNTVVEDTADDVTWTCRSPGDGSWDNASCILHYVLNHTTIAAGDTVYIDDGHNENVSGLSGDHVVKGSATANNPIKIICVNKADDSLSIGAIINPVDSIGYYGSVYSYGVTFHSDVNHDFLGASASSVFTMEGSGTTVLIKVATSADYIVIGTNANYYQTLKIINGSFSLGQLNNQIRVSSGAQLIWKGGSLVAANGVTALFSGFYRNVAKILIEDVDLSAIGAGATATSIVDASLIYSKDILLTRCKLPSAAGFTITSGSWPGPLNGKVRLYHCSAGDRYYDFHEESYEGTVTDETTQVRTGGASDGTTAQAWKMVSSANTVDNINGLESPPITIWNSATTEKTFTIECIWDSATNIQDDEIWMELEYPADNSSGLGAVANDKCAPLGTPANQATSTEDWEDEDSMANPNTFKLSVTATPGKAGPVTARVYLAKASTTVYVDPLITIS